MKADLDYDYGPDSSVHVSKDFDRFKISFGDSMNLSSIEKLEKAYNCRYKPGFITDTKPIKLSGAADMF